MSPRMGIKEAQNTRLSQVLTSSNQLKNVQSHMKQNKQIYQFKPTDLEGQKTPETKSADTSEVKFQAKELDKGIVTDMNFLAMQEMQQ